MAYLKRRNKKKYWILILAIIVVSIPIIYVNTHKKDQEDKSNLKLDNNTVNENNDIKSNDNSLEVGFDDYIDTPNINYRLYKKTPKVKGLYVNAHTITQKEKFNSIIDIANTTEINAFVIDIKDDDGKITYNMNNKESDDIKAERVTIKDIDGLMDRLYENDIYPIARIVAFKDPYASKNIKDYAIKNKDGSLWEYGGITWLNPYNEGAWNYVINVAKEAAKAGFKEIQFDYIRFEATKKLKHAYFGEIGETKNRMETIAHFVEYAMKELEPYNVKVSADVFGTIITSKVDARAIGQDYLKMAEMLDVICPMVYPSHYGKGFFGIPKNKHSDLYPYETIFGSMTASNKKYEELKGKRAAIVRPWLQAFTASYLGSGNYKAYGGEEIRAQIQAVYDAGLDEWILWHAGSKYTKDGLMSNNIQ
jgi:hypothetical protein